MTLTMIKPGFTEENIFRGTCQECGAVFEAESAEMASARKEQNCSFCNGVRCVKFKLVPKAHLLNG